MNDLKKIFKRELKKLSSKLDFGGIITKYKQDMIVFLNQECEVGYLGYTFVSSKYTDYNSPFGLYLSCRFGLEMDGMTSMTKITRDLNLSFPPMAKLPQCYFGFTSLYFLHSKFFSNGTFSFYYDDDISAKCLELTQKIKDTYFIYVYNFVNATTELIDNILEYPNNYGYPLTYILIQYYLNRNYDDVNRIIKLAREKNLYDSTPNKVSEIIRKLNTYFGIDLSLE